MPGAAIAYVISQSAIVRDADAAGGLRIRAAFGRDWKGKASIALYLAGVAVSLPLPWPAWICYVAIALMWLIPDRRIESALGEAEA